MAAAMRRSLAEGADHSESDIIDDALRDRARAQTPGEEHLDRLRRFIAEGDESGPGIPAEQVYAELRQMIATYEQPR